MKARILGAVLAVSAMMFAGSVKTAPLLSYQASDLGTAMKIWSRPMGEVTKTIPMGVYKGYYTEASIHRVVLQTYPESTSTFVISLGGWCYSVIYQIDSEYHRVKVCEMGSNLAEPMPSVGDARYHTPKLPFL